MIAISSEKKVSAITVEQLQTRVFCLVTKLSTISSCTNEEILPIDILALSPLNDSGENVIVKGLHIISQCRRNAFSRILLKGGKSLTCYVYSGSGKNTQLIIY